MSGGKQRAVKAVSAPASAAKPRRQDIQAAIDLYTAGRLGEAEAKALRLIEEYPRAFDVYNLLGAVQGGLGKIDLAIASYVQAITIKPDFAEAHNNLGVALRNRGLQEKAAASYRLALAANPDFVQAHDNLGNVLRELGRLDEAAASYGQAVRLQPNYAEGHSNLGNVLRDLGRVEEAVTSYGTAIELKPDLVEAHGNLGGALVDVGELEEAAARYRRALKIRPDYGEAFRQLAFCGTRTIDGDELRRMQAMFDGPDLSLEQKMHVAFGLGKAFADLEEYEKSFSYVLEGNRLKRESTTYSIEDSRARFRRVQEMFCPAFFADRKVSRNPSNVPIFVLGMPRSGTTLVEQILASHPDVFGAGELTDLNSAVLDRLGERALTHPEVIARVDDAELDGLASDYLARMTRRGGDAPRITDKMPHNFLNVGLIKLILPSASIIHVRRDPMDTCLSIFTQYFVKQHPYAYDLSELGMYYRLYEELMEHWRQVIPGAMFEVSYEMLVDEPERHIRAMLDHCGLSFDPACLDFHKTERSVQTMSAWQVRQPLYRSSVQKWQRYGGLLEPLRAALEGRTAETGACAETAPARDWR